MSSPYKLLNWIILKLIELYNFEEIMTLKPKHQQKWWNSFSYAKATVAVRNTLQNATEREHIESCYTNASLVW
jgi:hypothetical protein